MFHCFNSEVAAEIDNDTVLFVIGDHGMTRTGVVNGLYFY